MSMEVPYIGSSGSITITAAAPIFDIDIYKNGVKCQTLTYAASNKTFTSGDVIRLTYTPNKTIDITEDDEGDYYFIVKTNNMRAQAAVTGNAISSCIFFVTWGFTRSNYERTLIGYDGLLSNFGNGMLHFNSTGFTTKYGDYMLRVSGNGVQTSSDGGSTWKTVASN
jgi:hypothetical protein